MNTTNSDKTPDDRIREKIRATRATQQKPVGGDVSAPPSGVPSSVSNDSEIPGLNSATGWAARRMEELKALGKRLFVHLAMLVAAVTVGISETSGIAALCIYVGGICVVARGIAVHPAWIIPAGCGVLQTVLLGLFGLSFPEALFWGGMQTWAQRLFLNRFRMGSEWAVMLPVLPISIYILPSMPLATLAVSFAGMLAIGISLSRAVERKQTLEAKAEEQEKLGPPEPPRVVEYRASLADFSKKLPNLPEQVRGVAESIAVHTGDILSNMATDERDLDRGHRFLNRYFKAAHSVVDSYISLAREKVVTAEMAEALAKSEETLVRLDEVFAKEHTRMLKNDLTDFSADLAVIDTLLKMDGR